jgi:cold shock CspA family protein
VRVKKNLEKGRKIKFEAGQEKKKSPDADDKHYKLLS